MPWGTGFRVVTGTSHSIEYREEEVKVGDVLVGTIKKKRTITVITAEFRGLSENDAASKTATATYTITARDRADESGQWVVKEELTTYGLWEDA